MSLMPMSPVTPNVATASASRLAKVLNCFAVIVCSAFAFTWLSACNASKDSDTQVVSKKTLVMGVSADYPPFEFKKQGEIVGLDVDVAQEIAHSLGFSLILQDMDFSALIPALQTGRIDFAMSGMTITEERLRNIDFSDIYFTSTFALIVASGSSFTNEQDLGGKKIGVQLGTTMEKFAKEKAKLYPDMEIVALGKNPLLIQEVKSARLFGMIAEEVQALAFVKANPTLKSVSLSTQAATPSDGYAIAFPKETSIKKDLNPSLRQQINTQLDQMKKNGKLDQIRTKWLGK